MLVDIRMPKLGESITEGTIIRWLKGVGEPVAEYEPLLEIETDKVTTEYPSPHTGIVADIVAQEGQTIPVGGVIARIRVEGAAPADPAEAGSGSAEGAPAGAPGAMTEQASGEGAGGGVTRAAPAADAAASPSAAPAASRVEEAKATPFIRRLARKYGVDLATVIGSGPDGEITKADVLAAARGGAGENEPRQAASAPAPAAGPEGGVVIRQPSRVRQVIARRMSESVRTIPHAWLTMTVDATGLVRARESRRDAFAAEGVRLTYLPFFVMAAIRAVEAHPLINASWRDDGTIAVYERLHLGVAVAGDEGLIVPVLRDAQAYTDLEGLARALADLVERARQGALRPEDVAGGTFTVNNTGALGAVASMSIINPPQAAILNFDALREEVRLRDGRPVLGYVMNISLSFDHRILDGGEAAAFLRDVKARLEEWEG